MPGGRRTLFLVLCAALTLETAARGDPGIADASSVSTPPRPGQPAAVALRHGRRLYGGLRCICLQLAESPATRLSHSYPGVIGAAWGSFLFQSQLSGRFPSLSQTPIRDTWHRHFRHHCQRDKVACVAHTHGIIALHPSSSMLLHPSP